MPGYGGGKSRIGKEVYEVIKKIESKLEWEADDFFEPFCGMLGVSIHAAAEDRHVTACDANKDIMLMWRAMQKGWMPEKDHCTREEYEKLKHSKKHSAERGFIGVACGYGGIFFAGYRGYIYKDHSALKMAKRVMRNKVLPYLHNFTFLPARSYETFTKLKNLTIYCDPPYLNNNYASTNAHFKFDHEKFWNIMRQWSKKNLVIISEYEAPEDFVCIWSKVVKPAHSKAARPHTEKMFIHESYKLNKI